MDLYLYYIPKSINSKEFKEWYRFIRHKIETASVEIITNQKNLPSSIFIVHQK